jgi:predicted phosphodiesterase
MRLLILSDLHREVWRDHAPRIDVAVRQPDVVILAGDIDTGAKGVAWANATFAGLPVLYVHGNHEAYGHALDTLQGELDAACQATGHVHHLQMREHRLGGVRFLGCTLWTDFALYGDRFGAMVDAHQWMNDYRRIRLAAQGYRKLRPADTARVHARHRGWLEQRLSEPFDGRTVVITHMAPSARSVISPFVGDPLSAAFASNLDHLVERADLWIHGHMHTSLDYRIGRCRVVCNPLGYLTRAGTPENRGFNPDLVIELEI